MNLSDDFDYTIENCNFQSVFTKHENFKYDPLSTHILQQKYMHLYLIFIVFGTKTDIINLMFVIIFSNKN